MKYTNQTNKIDELKAKIDKYRPLNDNAVKQLKEFYRVGLTYASNALEGNSLTEVETKVILEDGLTIGGKSLREHQEVIGHSEAYDLLYTLSQGSSITENNIKELHRLFYHRIDEANAGTYRKAKVLISGSEFIPPAPNKVGKLMRELIAALPKMRAKYHPVEFAAMLHKEFVEIHPFVDGNGRTARLLMNLALIQAGYVITIIPPIVRRDYIQSLETAHTGDSVPFVNFITSMTYESMKDYLRLLKGVA